MCIAVPLTIQFFLMNSVLLARVHFDAVFLLTFI